MSKERVSGSNQSHVIAQNNTKNRSTKISSPTLIFGETKEEVLKSNNQKLINIFNKYDSNKDGTIDSNEIDAYTRDFDDHTIKTSNPVKNGKKLNNEQKATETLKTEAKHKSGLFVDDIMNNRQAKDLDEWALTNLHIDLSKCTTDEEKRKVLSEAFAKRYSVDKDNKDSLYNQAVARLKMGDYNHYSAWEKEHIGHKKLSNEQIEYYAQEALKRREIDETADLAYNIKDEKDQQLFVSTLINRDDKVKGALTGLLIESIKDPKQKQIFIEKMAKEGFHIDYTKTGVSSQAILSTNVIISENAKTETACHLILDLMKMDKVTQEKSFEVIGTANEDRLKNKTITKQQYNENYVTLANNAHKVDLASQAYKYIQTNSNNENRTDAMKALASHAYEIQDSNERGQAINGLTSSKYYNDDVKNSLNQSYNEYKNPSTSDTGSGAVASSKFFIATPKQEETTRPSISDDNNEHYEKMSDNELEQTTSKKIDLMNKEDKKSINKTKATDTAKRPHFTSVKMALDYCFTKKNLPDKIKAKIISKLQSANPVALRNLFLTCNNSVKEILLKNNLVSPTWVAEKLSDSELNEMPGYIHQRITEVKKDMLKHNATNPISPMKSKPNVANPNPLNIATA